VGRPIPLPGQNTTQKIVTSYFLPSNEEERKRLDMQNQFLTKVMFEGKLICVPQLKLLPGDEILETATGTGIWLVELAKEIPSTIVLTGIDIEQRLFPVQHPENRITFLSHSVTHLPVSWSNKFKLVNQRLLFGALTLEQWRMCSREIYRVLEPGGWVQLLEGGPDVTACSGPNMRSLLDSLMTLFRIRSLVPDVQYNIDKLLGESGFINVHKRTTAIPRLGQGAKLEYSEYEDYKKIVMTFFATAKPSLLATGRFESEVEYDRLLKGMDDEWNIPSLALWDWTVAYAQKPLEENH